MKREFHVRICESVGVRFPRATRPDPACIVFRSFSVPSSSASFSGSVQAWPVSFHRQATLACG
jgi:hypothetical protein